MSGIEVAGLALGVLPIVLEVVKSYKATAGRLNTLRHYVHAAFNLRLKYKLEESSFRNECQHLLAIIIDDESDLLQMLRDTDHTLWRDHKAETRLRQLLGQDYELCEDIVVEIRDILRETKDELSYLSDADNLKVCIITKAYPSPVEFFFFLQCLRFAVQPCLLHLPLLLQDNPRTDRILLGFKISFMESKHKGRLEILQSLNGKLRLLSSQRCQLLEKPRFSSACIIRKQVPSSFASVRASSQSLHDALADAWSCTDISHTSHQAKLSLDAKYDNGSVGLDMAISCRRRLPNIEARPPPEPPTWLYVRSVTTKTNHSERPTPGLSMLGNIAVSSEANHLSQSMTERTQGRAGKKRVRFDVSTDDEGPRPPSKETKTVAQVGGTDAQCHSMQDIRTSKSICSHLRKTGCLGYLEAKDTFRLVFYDASNQTIARKASNPINKDAVPLDKTLEKLSILQKLTLAHKLALTVLRYHSTSWLPYDWLLQDLAFFTDSPQASEDELLRDFETLHLSTQFPGKDTSLTQPKNEVNPTANAAPVLPVDEAKYRYNIKNMAMAKLGLALLEIGHRKDIQAFGYPSEPHDVINARRVLDTDPIDLGPRYQTIVEKCMDCNFSVGYDLGENDLQSAVYTDVVCELEDMLENWKKLIGKA